MKRGGVERNFDVVVIGGGAAGLFCAIEAGRRGRRVLVLEKNRRVGEKIAISGGGRCNFTNLNTAPDRFLSENPDFCRSALARFTAQDFIARVERHGIAYHEKTLGQLFCDGTARQIIEMLKKDCMEAGVEIRLACEITEVLRDASFRVVTDRGVVVAPSVVLATGGLSIPKLGASDFAYRMARRFGLKIVPTRPGLVPLTISAERLAPLRDLAGVSFPSTVRCNGIEFRESVLFTHRGLSGPAILQISSYWRQNDALSIDVLPEKRGLEVLGARRDGSTELATVLAEHLPRRMAQAWCALEAESRPMNQYSNRELEAVAARLGDWRLDVSGTEGFAKAEVTAGGIDTSELSSKTMEAKRVPGLFCIGEAVDVTGHLGGFNFQWAWSSAWAAGQWV
jgi:predicted Rossmann fold flavoprotein